MDVILSMDDAYGRFGYRRTAWIRDDVVNVDNVVRVVTSMGASLAREIEGRKRGREEYAWRDSVTWYTGRA